MAESFRDCAKRIGLTEEVEAYLRGDLDIDDPALMDAMSQKHLDAMNREYQAQLQAVALDNMHNQLDSYRTARGKVDDAAAARAFLTMDDARTGAVGVEQQIEAITRHYNGKLSQLIDHAQGGTAKERLLQGGAVFDKKFGQNMLREIRGVNSGDPDAKLMAKLWKDVAEELRVEYNRAGGFIRSLDDWGMPQKHVPKKMLARGKNEWVNETMGLLDRNRMKDLNGKVLDDDGLRAMLDDVFDTITTNGASTRGPRDAPVGGPKLGNKHRDHRVLHFKDADSWLKYSSEFGDEDVVGSMLSHITGMSRDLGMLQAMGPNPDQVYANMRSRVMRSKNLAEATPETWAQKKFSRSQAGVNHMDNIWDNMSGIADTGNARGAAISSFVRSWATAAKLGGALLSSLPDVAFAGLNSFYNGISISNWGKTWVKQQFSAGNARKMNQAQAIRMGVMNQQIIDDFTGALRFSDPDLTKAGRMLSNLTYKASLMTAWDRGNRTAYKMSMIEGLSTAPAKFADMNPRMAKTLDRYGIDQAEWNAMRKFIDADEGGLINPQNMPTQMVRKFMGMVESESNIGVVMPTARTRAVMNQGTSTGTIAGEVMRFGFQWRSFPLAVGQTQLTRIANTAIGNHGDSVGFQVAYPLAAIASLGTMGMISVQAKEIFKGRDPAKMNTAGDMGRLFGAGLVQAGAGGIFYDMVMGTNQTGVGPAAILPMPALRMFDESLSLGIFMDVDADTINEIDEHIIDHLGKSAAGALNWVPGQSLWYLRAAYYDMFQVPTTELLHPETARKLDRRDARIEREKDQGRFLRDGRLPESPFE